MFVKNKDISPIDKPKKGFTLVELIIVITILAVLATIAFVSFQGYTKNTRDANRLGTMNSMSKGLEISLIKNSVLPHPETPIVIYDNSETIGYQGYFGDETARITGFDKTPKDPLDDKKYTYLTSKDYKKFQLLSLMETSDYLTFSNDLFPKTFADGINYSKRIPKTFGYDLGILLGNGVNDKNKPVQENLSASFTGVNIDDNNTSYKAVVNNKITVSPDKLFSIKNNLKNGYDSSLISYWDMETSYMSGSARVFKNFVANGSDCSLSNSSLTGGIVGSANRISDTSGLWCNTNLKAGEPFSISYYYKINNELTIPGITGAGIFSPSTLGNNIISIYEINNVIYVSNSKNITTTPNEAIGEIELGKWYNIVFNYDGSKYSFYINGKLLYSMAENNMSLPKVIFNGYKIIDTTKVRGIKGDVSIDELKIYNKVLSESEIQNFYNKIKN